MAATATVLTASPAVAQVRPPARPTSPVTRAPAAPGETRGFLTLGAGGQLGTGQFSETGREPLYAEDLTWTSDYGPLRGFEIDAGGGWRVWRRLFAGGSYTYSRSSLSVPVEAEIPHPFLFDRPREISGDSPPLSHTEQAVHISALWSMPAGRRFLVDLFGGPSVLRVSRELVQAVQYTEEYPYDTATFSGATVGTASKTSVGAHAGVGLNWRWRPRIGFGATARYTWATGDVTTPAGGSLALDMGGFQTSVGVRIAFVSRSTRTAPRPAPPRRR